MYFLKKIAHQTINNKAKTSIDIPKAIKIFNAEILVTVVAGTAEALVDKVSAIDTVVLCMELIIIDLGISAIYLVFNDNTRKGARFYIKIESIYKVD